MRTTLIFEIIAVVKMLYAILLKCTFKSLSLYGQAAIVRSNEDGWAYFGTTFGDFGHNAEIGARVNGNPVDIYYQYGYGCPTQNNTRLNATKIFLSDLSQSAVFGALTDPATDVVVSIASTVRPIDITSALNTIFIIFLIFTSSFLFTTVSQLYFLNKAVYPGNYQGIA